MFSQQFFCFPSFFSCFPPAQSAASLWFLKRMGVFFVAVSAVRAKTTTDAPLAGHFGCSLEIGSCQLAQLRSYISSSMRPMSLPCWKIQPNLISV